MLLKNAVYLLFTLGALNLVGSAHAAIVTYDFSFTSSTWFTQGQLTLDLGALSSPPDVTLAELNAADYEIQVINNGNAFLDPFTLTDENSTWSLNSGSLAMSADASNLTFDLTNGFIFVKLDVDNGPALEDRILFLDFGDSVIRVGDSTSNSNIGDDINLGNISPSFTFPAQVNAVPEPGSLALVSVASLGVALVRRRRGKRSI